MTTSFSERLRARTGLPEGTLVVGVALAIHGVAAYGFQGLAARTLGAESYAPLGVVWAMVFLVGPGVFIPLEQEVSRAIAVRRTQGVGVGPVVRRAGAVGAIVAIALVVASGAAAPLLSEHLFGGEGWLVAAFALGLAGYAAGHLLRGTLSGLGRFGGYATYIAGEGIVRLAACIAFAGAGVQTVGPYGVAVGVAPFLAVLLALGRERHLLDDGPEAPWSELSASLGALLAGSVLSLLLMNAGVLAIELLADDAEAAAVGTFVAGLAIARVPFFLYQGLQGALLPKLSGLAGAGRIADFRTGLFRLVVVVGGIGVLGVVGTAALGPSIVRLVFSDEFELGRRTMTMMAAGVALYLVAMTLAQGLIAVGARAHMALGWAVGVAAFVAAVVVGDDLLLRVEVAMVVGAGGAVAAMGILLWDELRTLTTVAGPPHGADDPGLRDSVQPAVEG